MITGLSNYVNSNIQQIEGSKEGHHLHQLTDELKQAINGKNQTAIENTAKEFESVFVNQLLQLMFKDIEPDAMFGGGKAEEIFNSFALEEYAEIITERGGLGIADKVQQSLLQLQEG